VKFAPMSAIKFEEWTLALGMLGLGTVVTLAWVSLALAIFS
jgi:hypothetical protein